MANTTAYDRLNSMEDTEFIAGSTFTLNFEMFQEDGVTPLNLTGGSAEVRISYLGQPETSIVILTGVLDVTPINTWYAIFESSDTADLSGVFVMQPRVVDSDGDEFLPAQGRLVIVPENSA